MKKNLRLFFCLLVLMSVSLLSPGVAVPQGFESGMPERGPGGAGGAGRRGLQDTSLMKKEVFESPTDKSNLSKRLRFAKRWLMELVMRAGVDDIVRAVPRGTIRDIESRSFSEPEEASRDLDRVFQSLKEVDDRSGGGGGYDSPGRQGPGSRFREGAPFIRPAQSSPEVPGAGVVSLSSMKIDLVNPASGARLWAMVFYPGDSLQGKKYPAVIVVPGGLSFGSQYAFTREPSIFVNEGFVVAYFDPDGRGRSEGTENYGGKVHQDGLNAFIKKVSALEFTDKADIGVVSFSAGVITATGALARYPGDPEVRYFIDVEGPSSKRYMKLLRSKELKDTKSGRTIKKDEAWWREREAARWAEQLTIPYLRIQSTIDHVHGTEKGHAVEMIRAATNKSFGGLGRSPWTRVNGPENESNKVWSESNTPVWMAGAGMPGALAVMPYIKELSGKFRSGGKGKADKNPLYLFYVIHVHGPEDGRPEFEKMSREAFEGVTRTVESIAATLEKHNARGTFEVLQWYADGAYNYEGPGRNILTELEKRGHEVAVHAHSFKFDQWKKTRESLLRAGVKKVTTLGGRGPVELASEAGYTAITDNFSPLDFKVPEPIKRCRDWGHGDNTSYRETGNFIHPWRPYSDIDRFCENNPRGQVVYIDHVMGNWLLNKGYEEKKFVDTKTFKMGPLTDWHFDKLRPMFKAALAVKGRGQLRAWGFVSHEVEYQKGAHDNHKGTEAVDENAVKALDRFLYYIDGYGAQIKWARVRDIAERYGAWEKGI